MCQWSLFARMMGSLQMSMQTSKGQETCGRTPFRSERGFLSITPPQFLSTARSISGCAVLFSRDNCNRGRTCHPHAHWQANWASHATWPALPTSNCMPRAMWSEPSEVARRWLPSFPHEIPLLLWHRGVPHLVPTQTPPHLAEPCRAGACRPFCFGLQLLNPLLSVWAPLPWTSFPTCSGSLDHPFLKNDRKYENNQTR